MFVHGSRQSGGWLDLSFDLFRILAPGLPSSFFPIRSEMFGVSCVSFAIRLQVPAIIPVCWTIAVQFSSCRSFCLNPEARGVGCNLHEMTSRSLSFSNFLMCFTTHSRNMEIFRNRMWQKYMKQIRC